MSEHALTWGEAPSDTDKLWGTLAHLACFTGMLVIVGPLIILLLFQDKSKYIRYHAFQAILTQVGIMVVGGMLSVIFSIITAVTCGFGAVLYFLLPLLGLAPLWGAWQAWNGKWEGYPLLSDFGK